MTTRHTASTITDDALDALYAELDLNAAFVAALVDRETGRVDLSADELAAGRAKRLVLINEADGARAIVTYRNPETAP